MLVCSLCRLISVGGLLFSLCFAGLEVIPSLLLIPSLMMWSPVSEIFQPQWRNADQTEEMEGRGGVTLVYENSWGVNNDLLLE